MDTSTHFRVRISCFSLYLLLPAIAPATYAPSAPATTDHLFVDWLCDHAPGAHPYGQYGLTSPSTEMTVQATLPVRVETEAKTSEGKERNTEKKLRGILGSLGMLIGKGSESAKGTTASTNGHTPRTESASDGSTEGSDDTAQNGSQHKGSYEQGGVDGMEAYMNPAVGNPVNHGSTVAIIGKAVVVAGPTTKPQHRHGLLEWI